MTDSYSPANSPSLTVHHALEKFVTLWLNTCQENNPDKLFIEYDSDWPSLCYSAPDESNEPALTPWLPVKQEAQDMFNRLADALEMTIHPDIISFYTLYWSEHLSACTTDGELTLLQIWNQDDMERLRGNLIGHALNQQKKKLDISFFFAVTSPDDGMLSVNNQTGEVWFEYPGKKPVRKIANSLAEFLMTLQPSVQ